MNLMELKNDTARGNAIRNTLANIILTACIEEFDAENVRYIQKSIEVFGRDDTDGKNGVKITGESIAVKVGEVTDKDGATVDAIAIISSTVKAWNTKTNKSNKTTYAIDLDSIDEALAPEKE